MGDAMSKDGICLRCVYQGNLLSEYPCSSCMDGGGVDYMFVSKDSFPQEKETCSQQPVQGPEALAEAHWDYVEALLKEHHVHVEEIKRIGFHYKSAFIHGYKHAKEDYSTGE